jgi:hypothetical protein
METAAPLLRATRAFELHDLAAVLHDDGLRRELHAPHHRQVVDDAVTLGQQREARHIHHEDGLALTERLPQRPFDVLALLVRVGVGEFEEEILEELIHGAMGS